jgi:hypothetical protein
MDSEYYYAAGAELPTCGRHTDLAVGSSPVRSCGVTESRALACSGGGSGAEHFSGWQRCGTASSAMRWRPFCQIFAH